MAIPASQIVSVNPRVIEAGGNDLVINGLFLTENSRIPLSSIAMTFPTADSVGDYFGLDSAEYAAAQVYFQGYDGSFTKPTQVLFASRVTDAVAGWIRGAAYTGTLADLKAVNAGDLTLSIDGTEKSVSAVDLSDAQSFSAVAEAVQTALDAQASGVTCTYDSVSQAFVITSATTGAASSVGYASSTGTPSLANLMNLTQAAGAVLSPGSAALSVAENMTAIKAVTENWVTFTNLYTAEDDELLALAQWAGSQNVAYLFVCASEDPQLVNQSDTSSIAYQLAQANVTAVTLVYGPVAYAAFIMGTAASIDWNRRQGTINFAFKAQSGLAPTVEDATTAATLLGKTCNIYGNYATRNDQFIWLYDGSIFGDYGYIDPFINAIWFNAAIQVAVMQGLEQTPRVPYNDDGYSLIRAWLMDPIARAQNNGVIDPGVELSEAQKTELYQEAGMDITSYLNTDGYFLQVQDAGASVRATRQSPAISLWYTYGGSVNKIDIASTLIL